MSRNYSLLDFPKMFLERETGIEPASSAWKAEVLPLNYSRPARFANNQKLVEGEGFEPSKAEPSDLQSDPFDRSGTPPAEPVIISKLFNSVNEPVERTG